MKALALLENLFSQQPKALSKEDIADLLNTSPEAYAAFEEAYKVFTLNNPGDPADIFNLSSKDLVNTKPEIKDSDLATVNSVIEHTVQELVAKTVRTRVKGGKPVEVNASIEATPRRSLTPDDLIGIPKELMPQVLGSYMVVQTPGGAVQCLLTSYKKYLEAKNPKAKAEMYGIFRQGLDILDLEPLLYEMLKLDPNTMGKWLPALTEANSKHGFFKIPDTTIIQVPMTLLQLSRLDYMSLNQTTMQIVNEYCKLVFELKDTEEYFVKTGTFSSKFNFRNARVSGQKEVRELGEYLLYQSNLAVEMAGPLTQPSIYGVSSNNEWVVREYIPDAEDNPCIYQGLPLRTEYRVFIDCDNNKVLGVFDYWDRDLLKKRFSNTKDANSPHNLHDYIIIQKHQKVMDARFARYKDMIAGKVQELLPDLALKGQWSLDIMQNGTDFYLIDMAIAATSALKEKLPDGVLEPFFDNRIPQLPA